MTHQHSCYVDLVFESARGQLEYDWLLRPGANAAAIKIKVEGARNLHMDSQRRLILWTSDDARSVIRQDKPVAYQMQRGTRKRITARYLLHRDVVRFALSAYDVHRPLTIDPVLRYSYLGAGDGPVAVDRKGNAYFISSDGVAKLNARGSRVLHDFKLPASIRDVALDRAGNLYVTGSALGDLPTTSGAIQAGWSGYGAGECEYLSGFSTCTDAFVSKIDPTGTRLLYSTYLGVPDADDAGVGITVDAAGSAYVAIVTTDISSFPTTARLQPTPGGPACDRAWNEFPCDSTVVVKLNRTGSRLTYSAALGNHDDAAGVDVDRHGNAYIAGTADEHFPTTPGAFRTTGTGPFVAKLNAAGTSLIYGTYLGGGIFDYAHDMVVDSRGNAYVVGETSSADFPTVNPAQRTLSGSNCESSPGQEPKCRDAFALELNPSGSALVHSTYLGGSGNDFGRAIAVDRRGNTYVTGWTDSRDFPTIKALQARHGADDSRGCMDDSCADAFVAALSRRGRLVFSSYLGGNGFDFGTDIVVDRQGNAYLSGVTNSTDFPGKRRGSGSGFILKLSS